MSKIIVGVDQSQGSHDAIALASSLAGITGAELMLVNVFPYDLHPSRAVNAAFETYLRKDSAGAARAPAQRPRRRRRRGQGRSPNPSPAHGLHELAETRTPALIVVGSTHTGRAGRVLPGSTAERLLHGSPCPVAVAPKGYAQRARDEPGIIGCGYDGSPVRAARARGRPPHRRGDRRAAAGHPRLHAAGLRRPAAEGVPMGGHAPTTTTLQERASEELDAAVASSRASRAAEPFFARRRRRPRSSSRSPSSSTCCWSAPAATARCTPSWSAASPAASSARRPAR